jgi:hypothetical protein
VSGRQQKKAAAQAQQQQSYADQQAMEQQLAEQQAQLDAMAAQPAPAPPAAPTAPAQDDVAAQLTQLKGLVDQGILTQEEFDAKKKQLLGI